MGCYQSSMPVAYSTPGYRNATSTVRHRVPTCSTTSQDSKMRISFKRSSVKEKTLATVKYPCQTSVWIRGSPVAVEWTVLDASVLYVKIELCQIGSTATTLLSASAPNTGCYVYSKVPWGLIGEGFYIQIIEILSEDSTILPRIVFSEPFRVGNSRWPDSGSEGSVTPVSVRTSSSSTLPVPSRWQETSFHHSTPAMASCY